MQRCGHKRVQEARAVVCMLALPHPGMSGRRWESVWTPLPPTPFTQQVPRPCGFSLSNLPPLCADFVFLFLSFYCRRCLLVALFPPGRPPIRSPHYHQRQLGQGESTPSTHLPRWPAAIGGQPKSPTTAWAPQSDEPQLKFPLYHYKSGERHC